MSKEHLQNTETIPAKFEDYCPDVERTRRTAQARAGNIVNSGYGDPDADQIATHMALWHLDPCRR